MTGGAGFVGSHLVAALLDDGDEVVVLDNFLTGRRSNLASLEQHPLLKVVTADLLEPLPAHLADEPFDRVYHLASPASPVHYGRFPVETLLVNSVGTRAVLDLARSAGARFLLASTSEVYGDPAVHPQDEGYWGHVNPVGPRSCYDEGKRFAEALTVAYGGRGSDVRIARIFNTYGPKSDPADGRVVPNLCVQALSGRPLTVYGTGLQTRSFCFVSDLVRGLRALMEAPGLSGAVVNLGGPDEVTMLEIAQTIIDLTRSSSPIVQAPLPIDDPIRRRPDIAKAIRLLGWTPQVGLREGLAITLDSFREELGLTLDESPMQTSGPVSGEVVLEAIDTA